MSCKILSKEKISDTEFLDMMIKHHNVAVKMSQLIMMSSKDDFILDFARKTIFNQSNEVNLMEKLKLQIPNMQNLQSCNCSHSVISAQIEKAYPNIFSNLKCNQSHWEHLSHTSVQLSETPNYETISTQLISENTTKTLAGNSLNSVTDKEYVDHMMDHHKSGIDLAKLVIKSTKEPRILVLAQNIVLDQEKEIFMIKNLYGCLRNEWRNKS